MRFGKKKNTIIGGISSMVGKQKVKWGEMEKDINYWLPYGYLFFC